MSKAIYLKKPQSLGSFSFDGNRGIGFAERTLTMDAQTGNINTKGTISIDNTNILDLTGPSIFVKEYSEIGIFKKYIHYDEQTLDICKRAFYFDLNQVLKINPKFLTRKMIIERLKLKQAETLIIIKFYNRID